MLIGAFVAGLATTYVLQTTKVFGSETRIFGAAREGRCNAHGYETNANDGYSGDAAQLKKTSWNGVTVKFTQAVHHGKDSELVFGGTGSDAGEVALRRAKGIAVGKDPTGYWIDKTVAANTGNCKDWRMTPTEEEANAFYSMVEGEKAQTKRPDQTDKEYHTEQKKAWKKRINMGEGGDLAQKYVKYHSDKIKEYTDMEKREDENMNRMSNQPNLMSFAEQSYMRW